MGPRAAISGRRETGDQDSGRLGLAAAGAAGQAFRLRPERGEPGGFDDVTLLEAVAAGLEAAGAELVDVAERETGLVRDRLTGEVTRTGLVLPIGGVKEKVLAARRAGIRRVILPRNNKKDLRELPDHVRQEMQFHFVDRVEEVLSIVIPNLNVRSLALSS